MSVIRDFFKALGGDHKLIGRLQDGVTIAQHKNIPDEVLEGIYGIAYGYFQTGKYKEAHDMFLYLSFHNHNSAKYLAGLGAACFRMGKPEQAIEPLKNATKMDKADPGPALNLAHAFEAMGETGKARSALSMVISRCEGNTSYKPLMQVAQAMLQNNAPDLDQK
ncbi:SycD/LcrH family type III secretion system chaperone [Parendozoicomonas sp. Alg238-R29]|uniref:SycD/LcrH family type III secretion system chaperone n=1 Tax=Parendozoicomonas sp. Alg238-R29 TaxID=2993446 RepID=UPI00248F0233|nr:SycD/LcrH family type III secretion system chaperone [Parendozoicomonas sp. Alg238-R29]